MKKVFLSMILFMVSVITASSFGEEGFRDLTLNLTDTRFSAIGELKNGAILVGTSNGLYIKGKTGDNWKNIFISRGEHRGVNHIFVDGADAVYIATGNGLYKSNDLGETWVRIFRGVERENDCIFITADRHNKGIFYLGTAKGLFRTNDGGKTWKRTRGIMGNSEITSIAMEKEKDGKTNIFIICDNEVYKADENFKSYVKVFGAESKELENEEFSETEEDVEDERTIYLNDVVEEDRILYLATSKGLFISEDSGVSWRRFTSAGLSDRTVTCVSVNGDEPKEIFVGTKKGVSRYVKEKESWEGLYAGMESFYTKKLMLSRDTGHLWALCGNRVYELTLSGARGFPREETDTKKILLNFESEPAISEVQAMAVQYAEVNPDKIEKWRQGAKFKALLPKVSLSVDRSASDTYEIYTSTTTSYWFSGPSDKSEGWGINFSWDLADLVWSDAQTSIDVRSKLMV